MVAMKRVQLFAKGRYRVLDHRAKKWIHRTFGERDLNDIVSNFQRFSVPGPALKHRVNLVKGHVPGDVFDPTIPKEGQAGKVYREGDTVYYDAPKVDDQFAADVHDGKFDDISAELYDSPEDAGLTGKGLMLRRIAVLGGDVPKIKGLNPEGLARTLDFSENEHGLTVMLSSFSEDAMGRDEMMKQLLAANMSQEVLDTLDDVQLAEICKAAGGGGTGEAGETTGDDGEGTGDAVEPGAGETGSTEGKGATTDTENAGETTTASGEGEGGDNMPDIGEDKDASKTKFSEMCGSMEKHKKAHKMKFGEDLAMDGGAAASFSESPIHLNFSEDQMQALVAAAIKPVQELAMKATEDVRKELDYLRVHTFCETQLLTGRLTPADMDTSHGRPNVEQRLLLIDNKAKVHKFSEGGETKEWTALDAEMNAILQRPVNRTGEKLPAGKAGVHNFSEGTSGEVREKKFHAFAESIAEQLEAADTSVKEVVERWKASRPSDRAIIEKDYGFEQQ